MDKHRILITVWRLSIFSIEYLSVIFSSLFGFLRKITLQNLKQIFSENFANIKTFMTFVKIAFKKPGSVGAIFPSSKRLAKEMASYVNVNSQELVVELGAGTGVITQALLNRGILPHQLIAIEYDTHMATQLRARFPEITVIEGDAATLEILLKNHSKNVGAIVSGLPLRRLPQKTVQAILSAITKVLSDNGQFVQFTYDIRKRENFYHQNYQVVDSSIILRNIPPAKVSSYIIHP
jgi:phospholipid N-methyltransferase